eukprot:1966250-Pleurochrysis_carterae.AAC.2
MPVHISARRMTDVRDAAPSSLRLQFRSSSQVGAVPCICSPSPEVSSSRREATSESRVHARAVSLRVRRA